MFLVWCTLRIQMISIILNLTSSKHSSHHTIPNIYFTVKKICKVGGFLLVFEITIRTSSVNIWDFMRTELGRKMTWLSYVNGIWWHPIGLTSPKTACVQDRNLIGISGHLRELVPRHIRGGVGFISRMGHILGLRFLLTRASFISVRTTGCFGPWQRPKCDLFAEHVTNVTFTLVLKNQ
jgi:hypothetical protein